MVIIFKNDIFYILKEYFYALCKLQRRKLSKNETDAIFAIKEAEESFKEIVKNDNFEENVKIIEELNKIKDEYKNDLEYISTKDFDIFGGMSDDKTKIKVINNEKHRETQKDKYKVLNVNLETNPQEYVDNILSEGIAKLNTPTPLGYELNNELKLI